MAMPVSKYQVVIPQSVREQIAVHVGDLLEAKAESNRDPRFWAAHVLIGDRR